MTCCCPAYGLLATIVLDSAVFMHGKRSVYQELARLGSPEQQALLHKQLDDLAAPISFCKYKLKKSNDDDAEGLTMPDSPSAKLIQACFSTILRWIPCRHVLKTDVFTSVMTSAHFVLLMESCILDMRSSLVCCSQSWSRWQRSRVPSRARLAKECQPLLGEATPLWCQQSVSGSPWHKPWTSASR